MMGWWGVGGEDGFCWDMRCNVKPGLINPKRLFNWESTIEVSNHDYWGNTPPINKPWFINPGLTLHD